ncbi:MAG: hypothetical protein JWR02_2321 [Mucilaginibacter sp.]|nr:hypothetical protein [Mucilaginibacter sp.]
MKFFLAFQQSEKAYPIPAYSFWQHYIKNGITEAGYEWSECPDADWALGLAPQNKNAHAKWKQDTWEKTVAWLKNNPADIFLSYLYPSQVDEPAIREIQKTGIPCVNFFCDNVREYTCAPPEFKIFDLNWVPEYKAAKWYKTAGYSFINLPMPVWVEPASRVIKEETNNQVTFIGSNDIQRKLLFESLMENDPDIKLVIYGSGWNDTNAPKDTNTLAGYTFYKKIIFNLDFVRRQGSAAFLRKLKQRHISQSGNNILSPNINGPVSFGKYNRLTAESMITLGVNRYPSFRYPLLQPGSYSRLRDIEAPMLGACYLTEYTEGIDELYDIDNDIAVYRNAEELATKIKELKGDQNRRRKLKVNGQKQALNENSIPNSLRKIIRILTS